VYRIALTVITFSVGLLGVCVCVSFFCFVAQREKKPQEGKGVEGWGEREIIKWKMTVQFYIFYAGLYAAFNAVRTTTSTHYTHTS
jgi:hypothetical protein